MTNLFLIAEYERHHYIRCKLCNQYLDCRDLSQVFEHEHENLPEPSFTSSKKTDEPIEYIQGKLQIIQN
jgi:hypothetical protein